MKTTNLQLETSNTLLRNSFTYMFIGLLITAGVPAYIMISGNTQLLAAIQRYYWPLIIAEFAVVLILSFAINKISSAAAKFLFFGYALLNGYVFSILTMFIPITLLIYALAITSMMFLVLSVYGYMTREDLGKYSGIFMGALITLIILSIVNIFIKAPLFYWMVSVFGVVLFAALIAFDVNRIKALAYELSGGDEELIKKMGIMGALALYLDFLNLFVYVVRLLGGNSRD